MVRLGLGAISVLGVIVLTFILTYVIPGDPARQLAPRAPSAAVLESIRVQLHLDRPLVLQFGAYVGGLLRGDLGMSYVQREEVSTLIMQRLPATITLALAGVLCEMVLGTTIGVISALRMPVRRAAYGLNSSFCPRRTSSSPVFSVVRFPSGWAPVTGGMAPALVLPALTLD
jgi:peptide/nickel transport system permease protein